MSCSSDIITVHIIGVDGSMWSPQVKGCLLVANLKHMAINYFFSTRLQKHPQNCSAFSLMSVSKRILLNEKITVSEESLKNNDELILMESRHPFPPVNMFEENMRGPTLAEIAEATKHLGKQTSMQPQHINDGVVSDFQSEVQRILISLIEAAARLLSPSPDGMKIFNLLNEKMKKRGKPTLANPSVKQLTDMGFPLPKVLKALEINMMNVSAATEWLLQHESDPEEEEQPSTSHATPQNAIEAFDGLLQSLLSAKRRQFQPHSKYLQNLKEMGFEEQDIKEALKITGNNQGAACSWLLGDRKRSICEEREQGLDHNGPMYKAIMKNPVIQMNLTKPKVLLAFLSIVENPAAADLWINDDDTSPVLNQIFKTYHTEKLTTKPSSDDKIGPNQEHEGSSEDSVTSNISSYFRSIVDSADGREDLDDDDDEDEEE